MSTHTHGNWDQGGYCNNLLLDGNGDGNSCGYQKGPVHNHGPGAMRDAARELREFNHHESADLMDVAADLLAADKYEALIEQLIHKCARLQGIPVEHERLNWVLPTNNNEED